MSRRTVRGQVPRSARKERVTALPQHRRRLSRHDPHVPNAARQAGRRAADGAASRRFGWEAALETLWRPSLYARRSRPSSHQPPYSTSRLPSGPLSLAAPPSLTSLFSFPPPPSLSHAPLSFPPLLFFFPLPLLFFFSSSFFSLSPPFFQSL